MYRLLEVFVLYHWAKSIIFLRIQIAYVWRHPMVSQTTMLGYFYD